MIFNRYKRRITVALIKARMKLVDIEREKAIWIDVKHQVNCIMRAADVQEKIELLDAILKGREVKF